MTSGSTKKAMVYRFEREPLSGFLDSVRPLEEDQIQFLNKDGFVQLIPAAQVKMICFVRDWISTLPWLRNKYAVRPRQHGLWVRMKFQDGESVEATMANDFSLLDGSSISVVPPEPATGVQRVIVPLQAIQAFEVLGVVGSPLKKTRAASQNQLSMFD